MSRRPNYQDPSLLQEELVNILNGFKEKLNDEGLREKVLHLIPAFHKLIFIFIGIMQSKDFIERL